MLENKMERENRKRRSRETYHLKKMGHVENAEMIDSHNPSTIQKAYDLILTLLED